MTEQVNLVKMLGGQYYDLTIRDCLLNFFLIRDLISASECCWSEEKVLKCLSVLSYELFVLLAVRKNILNINTEFYIEQAVKYYINTTAIVQRIEHSFSYSEEEKHAINNVHDNISFDNLLDEFRMFSFYLLFVLP